LRDGGADGGVVLGNTYYSIQHIRRSAKRLSELASVAKSCLKRSNSRDHCDNRALHDEFRVYTTQHPARFTAYYTPSIDVAVEKNSEFRYPFTDEALEALASFHWL
jgi:hypothetical protein